MASDYEAISADHRRGYGEWVGDFGEVLVGLYADPAHFVLELLQNAQDAGATMIAFELRRDQLDVRHDGRPFNEADVRSVCGIARSTKEPDDPEQIGRFGVGFKSVYAYTRRPEIHSGDEHFAITDFVHPELVEAVKLTDGWTTLQTFPLNHGDAVAAHDQIAKRLDGLSPRTILFLRDLQKLTWSAAGRRGSIQRDETEDHGARRVSLLYGNTGRRQDERWLIFDRPVQLVEGRPPNHVEVAFELRSDDNGRERIVHADDPRLVAFFPTARETHVGFLIQGPFIPTAGRDNIREGDATNERLVAEVADLTVRAMAAIRDQGLLDVGFLECLPLRSGDFPDGSLLSQVYELVRKALLEQPLLPTDDNRYLPAVDARLARGAELRELISPAQLGALLGLGRDIAWLHADISQDRTPDLHRYLAGYESRSMFHSGDDVPALVEGMELNAAAIVRRLSPEFLDEQSDEWVARLYSWFAGQRALTGRLREAPVIRTSDRRHVAAFRDERPQVWLPPDGETTYQVVDRSVASDPPALEFLIDLGLTVPDVVDEVLETVVPRYEADEPKPPDHLADLALISHAMVTAKGRRRELEERLEKTTFLLGCNAATGEECWVTPGELYDRTDELKAYLEGNPEAWFICGESRTDPASWQALGLATEIRVDRREPDYLGYVVVQARHSYHVRGLDRFDPGLQIEHLDWALENITPERSGAIWHLLMALDAPLQGIMERGSRQDYRGAIREDAVSPAGELLLEYSWILSADGQWCSPTEISLDELDGRYHRDESLAARLGMVTADASAVAQSLGIDVEGAALLRRHPELVARMIEKAKEAEAASRQAGQPAGDGSEEGDDDAISEPLDILDAIETAFVRPGKTQLPDWDGGGQAVDPTRRRKRAAETLERAQEREPKQSERWQIVPRKRWEVRDPAVREYLEQTYGGRCQICRSTFPRGDGRPFFEAKYLTPRIAARWVDTPGNSLCLCPTCMAKFMYAAIEGDDVMQQLEGLVSTAGELPEGGSVHFTLCGEPVALRFAQRHLIDLGALLASE